MPLFSKVFSCPSCGGEMPHKNPASRSVSCPYCGQTSHIHADSVEAAGEQRLLIDYGSFFRVGMRGKLNGHAFHILGRLRVEYEDGFWDEWYTHFPEKDMDGWIQEDDGSFLLFLPAEEEANTLSYEHTNVGGYYGFTEKFDQVFITSKSKASVQGGEGELPFAIVPGDPADFVEGVQSGVVLSVEIIDDGQHLYIGKPFTLDKVEVSS